MGKVRRSADIADSRQSAARSAPTNPGVMRASSSRSTSCGERHVAAVDAQDLDAALHVGRVQADLAVEAAGAAQRGIERVGAVRRADDDHLPARAQAVHQRQELADDALLDLAPDLGALGRDGVDLVEEDDAGRGAAARR